MSGSLVSDGKFYKSPALDSSDYDNTIETVIPFNQIYTSLLYRDTTDFEAPNTTYFEFTVPVDAPINGIYQLYIGATWFGPINKEYITIHDSNGDPVSVVFDVGQEPTFRHYAWKGADPDIHRINITTLPRQNGGTYFWIMDPICTMSF